MASWLSIPPHVHDTWFHCSSKEIVQVAVHIPRCSYAIYLAHNDLAWRRSELIVDVPIEIKDPPAAKRQIPAAENKTASTSSEENIAVLRRNGIATLFHFTDAANLESIRKNGLMSASTLPAP